MNRTAAPTTTTTSDARRRTERAAVFVLVLVLAVSLALAAACAAIGARTGGRLRETVNRLLQDPRNDHPGMDMGGLTR